MDQIFSPRDMDLPNQPVTKGDCIESELILHTGRHLGPGFPGCVDQRKRQERQQPQKTPTAIRTATGRKLPRAFDGSAPGTESVLLPVTLRRRRASIGQAMRTISAVSAQRKWTYWGHCAVISAKVRNGNGCFGWSWRSPAAEKGGQKDMWS
jgi:hypothetical protein